MEQRLKQLAEKINQADAIVIGAGSGLFQGDFRYFQCSQPCHDQVYDNINLIDAMMELRDGLKILPEAVPRCPECGRRMIPWVRDCQLPIT